MFAYGRLSTSKRRCAFWRLHIRLAPSKHGDTPPAPTNTYQRSFLRARKPRYFTAHSRRGAGPRGRSQVSGEIHGTSAENTSTASADHYQLFNRNQWWWFISYQKFIDIYKYQYVSIFINLNDNMTTWQRPKVTDACSLQHGQSISRDLAERSPIAMRWSAPARKRPWRIYVEALRKRWGCRRGDAQLRKGWLEVASY